MASSSIEQALYTRVIGDATITASLANRVFFSKAEPDTTMPYAVYFVVSDPHDAFAFAAVNTGNARIQMSVFSTDRYDSLTIAHNIRKRVRHFGGTWDGMTIMRATAGGTRLLPEPDRPDVYQATFDIMVQYVDAS